MVSRTSAVIFRTAMATGSRIPAHPDGLAADATPDSRRRVRRRRRDDNILDECQFDGFLHRWRAEWEGGFIVELDLVNDSGQACSWRSSSRRPRSSTDRGTVTRPDRPRPGALVNELERRPSAGPRDHRNAVFEARTSPRKSSNGTPTTPAVRSTPARPPPGGRTDARLLRAQLPGPSVARHSLPGMAGRSRMPDPGPGPSAAEPAARHESSPRPRGPSPLGRRPHLRPETHGEPETPLPATPPRRSSPASSSKDPAPSGDEDLCSTTPLPTTGRFDRSRPRTGQDGRPERCSPRPSAVTFSSTASAQQRFRGSYAWSPGGRRSPTCIAELP